MTDRRSKSKNTKKKSKITQNYIQVIQEFIRGKGYIPLSSTELIERLKVHEDHHKVFRQALSKLVKDGFLLYKKKRYGLVGRKSQEIISGTLSVHPRGFAFLSPDNPTASDQDIFIPKHLTGNAVDGDQVEVAVDWEHVPAKGPEGKVVSIVNRGRTHLSGIILHVEQSGAARAHVPILGTKQAVRVQASEEYSIKRGDRVVMHILQWGDKEQETVCEISHVLGPISDPSLDIPSAIENYELRGDFPTRVKKEAKAWGTRIPASELKVREDLRHLECVTIDPETAKDFDDAITLEQVEKGHYLLGVHIADVSHYVSPGSALDKEASLRSNSTYFPGYCLPMIPSALSDQLCSLRPNVNRLTVSIFMRFNSRGRMIDYRVARSVIRSKRRFSYEEAKEVLDGTRRSKHKALLERMVDLCHLLKGKRRERGSVELFLPEYRVQVDEKGVPFGIEVIEYDITHQMIEEFMLKANETVAAHLSAQDQSLTYRVHDEPNEEDLASFRQLARAFGHQIGAKPDAEEIQNLFHAISGRPESQFLATAYIRCMKLAQYSTQNIGHYGLSLEHYCHFTSPIRRYADLVAHRALFGELEENVDVPSIAKQCSEQERVSARAEGSVLLLKKLRLLQSQLKKDPGLALQAVVTRVKPFGLIVELEKYMVEGFIHVSNLHNDYYVFNPTSMVLQGENTGERFQCGERVSVSLDRICLITLETEWSLLEKPRKRKKKRKK
ncbi:MAG: ribonuclease R [Waddliaceae bacterium]|nr:ribonuclease R [Waddliaceae bacterium]